MRKVLLVALGGALASLFLLPATQAWSQATSGTIKGEVVTTDDVPIDGAIIRIESPALMGIRNASSSEVGRFRFPGLPAGPYTLTCEKEGYKTLIRRGLVVETGRTVNLKLVMDLPEMGETVEIIDRRPSVDTEKTEVGDTISHDFLGELPTGRSYQEVIQFLPGVTGGANPNVHGATDSSNQYYVDGVNTTDPVTNTFSMNFNFDAIQDIQVVTGAFDAKYGQALGGIISVTTKSGGNKFEGDFYAEYTTSALQSHDRFVSEDIQEIEAVELSASLGGPIVKDHLWFFIAYDLYIQDSLNLPALDTGRDLARFPVLPRAWRSHFLFGKLSWQISMTNKLSVSAQANPTMIKNGKQDIYTLPDAEYDWQQGGWYLQGTWDWTPSAYTVVKAQAYYQKSFIRITPSQWRDCTDWDPDTRGCNDQELNLTPHWDGSGNAFNWNSDGTYYWSRRHNFSFDVDFDAYFDLLGTHAASAGVDVAFVWHDRVFEYVNNDVIWDAEPDHDGDGLPDANEVNDIANYEPLQRAVVINADPYRQTGRKIGAYVQDIWKPWSNLTLRPGVRFDHGAMKNNEGNTILGFATFSPRIFASWDPANDRKTRIHGGYGKFVDSGYLYIASFANRTEFGAEYYSWDDRQHRWNTDGSRAATPTPDLMHYDLTPASVDEFNIGVEREIQKDLSADVTYIHRDFNNTFEDDEVNLIWSGDGMDVVGSRTGVQSWMYRLRTPGRAYRQYDALEFTLSKNLSDNLQFTGSYTWSRTVGNYEDGPFTGDMDTAWQGWYENGVLSIDRPHVIKMQGIYDNPGRIKISEKFSMGYGFGFVFYLRSGQPFNKYYYNNFFQGNTDLRDRRGSEFRMPATSNLDLRGTLKFTVVATQIDLVVMIENLLNSREIVAVDQRATDADGNILVDDDGEAVFAQPLMRQFPRQVRFALRVHF